MKNKVVTAFVKMQTQADKLSERLNKEGANGWRVKQASTGVLMHQSEYDSNYHCIVLEESDSRYEYTCVFQRRAASFSLNEESREKVEEEVNGLIEENEQNGFNLIQILQGSIIGMGNASSRVPRYNYFLIFEKSL